MAIDSNVLQEVVDALKQDPEIKNNVYQATVSRIDGEGVVWVNIAGSDTETPTAITSAEVAPGDAVNVEWRNNKLYIGGNYSNPSAGVVRVSNVEQIADVAVANASRAQTAAANAETYAQDAKATADAVHDIAVQASEDADAAKDAADSSQESADSAMVGLSTVQDVVGVLNWITAHGTMVSQYGEAFDPDKVYFIVDPAGDYVVSGTHYSVVPSPVAEDIDSYYILNISESVQNYVATHIVVDTEGLWIIPDAGGNKVLIATGSGSTYTTSGTYIVGKVNGVDAVFAKFTADGATMQRGSTGIAHLGYGPGTSSGGGTANAPYYTLGVRTGTVGNYSTAEGYNAEASGYMSHAEGNSTASGYCSHAEGNLTYATGKNSHAQNHGTYAQRRSQTAIGEFNELDTSGADETAKGDYIFIVGNGTGDNTRNNALTVDWSGNTNVDGDLEVARFLNVTRTITSSASISATGDITAGGNVEAAGDVTDGAGNTLSAVAASVPVIAVETKTLATSVNVSANSTTSSYNIPTKSGYTIAAVTPMVTGSYNGQYFAAITTSDNNVPTSLYFKNTHTSAHTNSFYIRVIYIKD